MINSIVKILLLFISTLLVLSGQSLSQNNQAANQDRLAKSFLARGQVEEAQKIYLDLHRKQPHNYQYYQSLNKILISQKKYQESLELILKQIKISNNKVSLYGDLGSVYFLKGNEQKATKIWNNALELEPNNAFAYRTIANYMFENRIIDRAIEVLKKGNEVSKDKTIFSYDIANYYSLTMKYGEATKEYCKILIQKPKQLSLIKNRIISYVNANQATLITLRTVEELYEDDENILLLQLLADLYTRTNNKENALKTVVQIEEETTRNGSAIFAFAQQSTRIRDYKIAALAYKKIITDYPKSALFSESEIGYTRSLEADLNNKSNIKESWKPFVIKTADSSGEFYDLLIAYGSLSKKYHDSKVGLESEYRMAKIYLDNLGLPLQADSIFNKITKEVKSLQYIDVAYFGLAQVALERGNFIIAEEYLVKVLESRLAKPELISKSNFLLAKTKMWKGEFTKSIGLLNKVIESPKENNVNDALQYSLLLNTFKNDSTNLFSFSNADYLIEKKKFNEAATEFKKLADDKSLFLLKDFAALRYIELQLALNNYQEAIIFLEEVSNCDEDNIYKDRFLYLLGSNYYYGLNNGNKALASLTRIFDEYPNSIYYNKARKIIYEINVGVKSNI